MKDFAQLKQFRGNSESGAFTYFRHMHKALYILSLLFLPIGAIAQTFSCEYEGFRVNGGEAYSVDLTSSDETYLGDLSPSCNAIGYNVTDGYIWGSTSSVTAPGKIIRIASDLSTEVYSISGLPAAQNNVGDISADGVLYMRNSDFGTIYRVDLNPESATYLQKLDNLTTTVTPKYRDWAFSPVDGNLYTVDGNGQLVRIDPATGTRSNIGVLSGAPEDFYGTVFMDNEGTLYIVDDQSGDMYKIPDVHEDNLAAEYVGTNTDGAGSSDGAMCMNASNEPLSVQMKSFSAQAKECGIILKWSSGKENNFGYYILERSIDNHTYQSIINIPSQGSNSDYSFTDNNSINGSRYYRLRLTDHNGRYEYSKVISTYISCNSINIHIYPNPADDKITISGVRPGQVLQMTNMIGQHVVNIELKDNLHILPLSDIAPGVYYITINESGNMISNHKIIKQ